LTARNGWEAMHRALKVDRLVAAAVRVAQGRGITDPVRIAEAAARWTDQHWAALKSVAPGVKHMPSATTRAAVIERLRERAKGAAA